MTTISVNIDMSSNILVTGSNGSNSYTYNAPSGASPYPISNGPENAETLYLHTGYAGSGIVVVDGNSALGFLRSPFFGTGNTATSISINTGNIGSIYKFESKLGFYPSSTGSFTLQLRPFTAREEYYTISLSNVTHTGFHVLYDSLCFQVLPSTSSVLNWNIFNDRPSLVDHTGNNLVKVSNSYQSLNLSNPVNGIQTNTTNPASIRFAVGSSSSVYVYIINHTTSLIKI